MTPFFPESLNSNGTMVAKLGPVSLDWLPWPLKLMDRSQITSKNAKHSDRSSFSNVNISCFLSSYMIVWTKFCHLGGPCVGLRYEIFSFFLKHWIEMGFRMTHLGLMRLDRQQWPSTDGSDGQKSDFRQKCQTFWWVKLLRYEHLLLCLILRDILDLKKKKDAFLEMPLLKLWS